MKKSNSYAQSKLGISDKDSIPTPMLCHVNIGMLDEIEGSRNHSV